MKKQKNQAAAELRGMIPALIAFNIVMVVL